MADTPGSAAPVIHNVRFGTGRRFGLLLVRFIPKILVFVIIVLIALSFLSHMQVIAQAERDEADAAILGADTTILGAVTSYGNSIRHRGCKSGGGCGQNCPYTSKSDPRVMMCGQVDALHQMLEVATRTYQEELSQTDVDVASFSTSSKKTEVADTLKSLDDQRKFYCSALAILHARAKELKIDHGSSKTLTTAVVEAGNRVSAIEAVAAAYMQIMACSVMNGRSYLMQLRFNSIEADLQKKIYHFDDKAAQCMMLANSIKQAHTGQIALLSTPEVEANLGIVSSPQSGVSAIVSAMATFMAMLPQMQELSMQAAGKYQQLSNIYRAAMRKVEGFSNDLPGGKMDADKVSTLIESGDYNTALIKTALEPEIITNQKKFARERSSFDSGGGVPSVRDDDNDVVPWVGLFGRPTYRKSDGSSMDKSSEPLRSIPSDVPADLMRKSVAKIQFA